MTQKAALVTGASSGIGLAVAHMLGEEGYGLTVVARRADKLTGAAEQLRQAGHDVHAVPTNLAEESGIQAVVKAHQACFGSLDLLVNNAGVGIGAPVSELRTDHIDMQISVNFRAMVLFYRECVPLLRASVKAHGSALVINTASIAGKFGQGWLSVYSATKHAVVGFTEAMNQELGEEGIKSCALCPGFVDTPMTDFAKKDVSADKMIQPSDIAEVVRALLKLSPNCVVPEVMFTRPGETL